LKPALIVLLVFCVTAAFCPLQHEKKHAYDPLISATLRTQVLQQAAIAVQQLPVTVTSSSSPRSAGGKHDFFSEGDYWWPNPLSADSPYIQRDGMTNPGNFVAHRQAMIRFSSIMGALGAAYVLTGRKEYVQQAMLHCKAWFIDETTVMHPQLLYAQAIKGRFTGRGIGIIDGIHLMEVVKALEAMQSSPDMDQAVLKGTRQWFTDFLEWLTHHQYGKDEMNAHNNHGTCWVMQVAVFAKFTGDSSLQAFCRNRFKQVLLPEQMAADGSFPLEMKRTKPYGYSIFNLDAMATICQELSDKDNDLWNYSTASGQSIKKGISFLYPYIADKSTWPFAKDVMYWEQWPVAPPSLLFGARAFNNKQWLGTWQQSPHAPVNEEVIRNLPVRQPLIWLQQ